MATPNIYGPPTSKNPVEKAVDITKSCRTNIGDVLEIRKGNGNQYVPVIYKQVYFILLLVELNLAKTKDFVHYDGSDEDKELAAKITNVVQAIDLELQKLDRIIRAVKPTLKTGKLKSIFGSATVPWQEPNVRVIGDQIMTYQVLLLRAGAPPLSSEEIADIADTTKIAMDWRVEEHITDLKAYQRGSISGPAGLPDGMPELTLTTSTVRRPSAFYNVYGGRIIGTLNTDAGPIPQVIEGVTPKPLTSLEEGLQKVVSRPGPAALQFESPHLGGLVLTTSVPEMNLSLPNGDPARSASVNSSQLPPPADPAEAFERVLREIRNAKVDAFMYPAISLQVYRKALRIINSIPDSGPLTTEQVLFFKVHYATICEIGLSRIEAPPSAHLGKALKHNERAFSLAEKLADKKITARATLDKAQIKSRTAQVQERTGLASKSTLRTMTYDSYLLFEKVVTTLRDNCASMPEYFVLASALLGAGKQVKKMGTAAGGGGATGHENGNAAESGGKGKRFSLSAAAGKVGKKENLITPTQDAQEYFLEALKVVEEGIGLGREQGEGEEALEEMALISEDVLRQMSYLPSK